MSKPIVVVQGGQWGSEGKGMVSAALCKRLNIDCAVRTGSVNAGHTVYEGGKKYAMQQIPTGWVNPETHLLLGPGAYINPDILQREVRQVYDAGFSLRGRLTVDYKCSLHLEEHTAKSTKSGRHHKMGATGKGCSESIVDKLRSRGSKGEDLLFRTHPESRNYGLSDVPKMLTYNYHSNRSILIEGTQGSHLDLHLGPYPFTTSRMTNASNWVAEAGLPPSLDYEVALVIRTYPIRVAGNSGPMPKEISWPTLARRMNLRRRTQVVDEEAIRAFEKVGDLLSKTYALPLNRDETGNSWDFHNFTANERENYKAPISELHKAICDTLPEATVRELSKLFEFTTVTKKLRRVAEFDHGMVRESIIWNNPAYLILTFFNYVFPETWGWAQDDWKRRATEAHHYYLAEMEDELKVPIKYITTGPYDGNFIER